MLACSYPLNLGVPVPAYCDRILWRACKASVKQHFYHSYPTTISDHRPVASFFTVDVKGVRPEHMEVVRVEVEGRIRGDNRLSAARALTLWQQLQR